MRLPLTIDSIAAGGDGVGRDSNNRAVFVPGAAPGDEIEVEIELAQKSFARGRIVALTKPSPQRATPPCPYYLSIDRPSGKACGGCQLQHLNYAAQLEAKTTIVRDALKRIARITDDVVQPCVASLQSWAYRNKADFVLGYEKQQPAMGYFARASHHLVDIDACLIQQEPNNQILTALRQCLDEGRVEPFDPATGRGVLRRLLARTASDGSLLLIALTTQAEWHPGNFVQALQLQLPKLVGILRRRPRGRIELLHGRDWLEYGVGDLRLRVSNDGFFQVNDSALAVLVQTALSAARVLPGERVLDLYCGVGLFSLAMARLGADVTGVENDHGSVIGARFNAEANGLTARFKATGAVTFLQQQAPGAFDTILLDPPRDGAMHCMPEIVRIAPKRIIYVSCDPATLARDVRALLASGYLLRWVQPIDMFPQTAHVESVALLEIG